MLTLTLTRYPASLTEASDAGYRIWHPNPNPYPNPNPNPDQVSTDEQVRIEQDKLQQLCLYQLVLGYRLREAEATGEAQQRLGL